MESGWVIKSTGSRYMVKTSGGKVFQCGIRGKFRIHGIKATNPVAVGDRVRFEPDPNGESGTITHIEERKNYLIRKSSNLARQYQLLASNVDMAWLMITLVHPKTLTPFIDRFLVSTEAYRIPVTLLFNKVDLYGVKEKAELEVLWETYSYAGYPCLRLSLVTGEGVEEVRARMEGKVHVIAGNSGVGKSTLINVLDPSFNLKTGTVSRAHGSGIHTTTFAEMFELKGGIRIIDTPGIRGFGTVDIERSELYHFFPEIFRASHRCRYHNCMHINEPGCHVREEVNRGGITSDRYMNYLVMMEEEGGKYRQ